MSPPRAVDGSRLGRLLVAAFAALALSSWVAGSARAALLPPHNPARSLSLDEHARPTCAGVGDYTATCLQESLAILNAGRRSEHLGPLVLPRNWSRLTVAEQIFVLTELERTARGLRPDTGLAADWNRAAQAGADAGRDPTRTGAGAHGLLSIWAGGQVNPIIAMVGWIYDDGYFPDRSTQNLACSSATPSGCWGHRDAILHDTAATACGRRCAVGAAYSATGFSEAQGKAGRESYAEVFGVDGANNPDPLVFTWASELDQLPACERVADACGWARQPLLKAAGVVNVRGLPGGASLIAPWFPVGWSSSSTGLGAVTLSIAVGLSLRTVAVTATQGARRVALHVSGGGEHFEASGQLGSGLWRLSVRFGTPAIDGPRPSWTTSLRLS